MKKENGFTLIELLAVIVILAVIAIITIPLVSGIIDKVRISAYKQSLLSIFDATDLYLATNNFGDIPEEGINVTEEALKIDHKDFTSGKILKNQQGILELERVSNGQYCGNGIVNNITVVEGSCDQLDTTPPTIAINSNLITSSLITVIATAEDLESGISGYQFSKDDGVTWTSNQASNVYTFTGLTNDSDYNFKIKVFNNNNLETLSESIVVRTSDIELPLYSIDTTDWSQSKLVTITYPTRQDGYLYEYSLDNALTWNVVVSPAITKDIIFNANGNVIARIFDGTNEISGASYVVTNIDTMNPSVVINVVGTPFNVNGWANANFNLNVQSNDNASGIDYYKYCQTTSTTCTPSTVVNAESGNVAISTESATNKVCVQAFDNANNSSAVTCSSNYKLDKTLPIAGNINLSGTLGTNGWYKTNVTVSKTDGSDILSGHASTALSHTAVTIETTGITITLTTMDNAGNTAIKTQIVKLDKTVPVLNVPANATITTEEAPSFNIMTGVTTNDNLGLVPSLVTSGTVGIVPGDYTITYTSTDAAGNQNIKTRVITVYKENKMATGTAIVNASETITVTGLNFTPKFVVIRGYAEDLRYIALASTPLTTTGLNDDAYSSYLNVGNTTCTKVSGGFTYVVGDNGRNKFGSGTVITWYAYEDYEATGTAIVNASETISVTGLGFTPSVVVVRGYADDQRYIAIASTPQTTTGLNDDAYTSYLNVGNTTCTKVSGGFTYVLGDNGRNKFGSGTVVNWYVFK